MKTELERIRKTFIDLVGKIDSKFWIDAQVMIDFPPFINKGYTTTYLFKDADKNILPVFLPFDFDLQNQIIDLIFRYNHENQYNRLTFDTRKDDYENSTLNISFSQEVEKNFQNNLPKSKRGKTIPWWKNPDETKGLI